MEKLSKMVIEKKSEIKSLEETKQNNESVTLEEQKSLELKLVHLKKTLEIEREKLKNIDKKLLNNENTYENHENSDEEDEEEEDKKLVNTSNHSNHSNMSQSLFMDTNDLLNNIPSSSSDKNSNLMSKSFNENWFLSNRNIEVPAFNLLDSLLNDTPTSNSRNTSTSTSTPKKHFNQESRLNFSFDEDLLKTLSSPTNGLQENNRTPSQDDIDRISKVTASAPISNLASSNHQIRKSFEQLEQNRKNFLASQGTNVIDGERQKMEMLKKRSSDAARAEYLKLIEMRESQEKELLNGL